MYILSLETWGNGKQLCEHDFYYNQYVRILYHFAVWRLYEWDLENSNFTVQPHTPLIPIRTVDNAIAMYRLVVVAAATALLLLLMFELLLLL